MAVPWPDEVDLQRTAALVALKQVQKALAQCRLFRVQNPRIRDTALADAKRDLIYTQRMMAQAGRYTPPAGRWPQTAKEIRDRVHQAAGDLIQIAEREIRPAFYENPLAAESLLADSMATVEDLIMQLEGIGS